MSAVPPTPDFLLSGMRAALEETGVGLPMIFIGLDDELVIVPVVGVQPHEMLELFALGVTQEEIPPVNWLALVSDSYRLTDTTAPEGPVNLANLFQQGDPRVEECLMGYCIAPDGPTYEVFQPYVHNDEGYIWGEIEDRPPVKTGGRLLDLTRELLNTRPGVSA